ncbi:hypothetical protein FQN55_007382 [Onygenales sp. PD_40]|nr:hypothetical protein FQN55_007382 [Onygenales sp. PD_40]
MKLFAIVLFVASVLGQSRTSPPEGAIVVAPSGGDFTSIQEAVDSLSDGTAETIYIAAGTYKEQVYIPPRSAQLTIYGETEDTASYSANVVTVTQGKSQDDSDNNDLTATLRNWAANSKVYNINLENTRGEGSQALAVSAQASNQGYYGCQFLGYQDTVLANEGTQVYAASLIQGATDFIFGQRAAAWFDSVDIRVLSASKGYITANGRDSDSNPSYYVIHQSTVAAADGNSVSDGAYYLGRPWREYARVVFQGTSLSSVINSAGWIIWNSGDERTSNVLFGEYGNSGDGSGGSRANFATALSAAIGIEEILGGDYADWVDTSYLA